MTIDPVNRMSEPKNRGGRPSLVEKAKRDKAQEPEPMKAVEKFKCPHCGHLFLPRVYRTLSDGARVMRCDGCGTSHRISQELLARLL